MVYRSPDDDGFDMSELQAEAAKLPRMSSPADVELPPLVFDHENDVDNKFSGCIIAVALIVFAIAGLAMRVGHDEHTTGSTKNEPKLTTEEALLVEIFEYDYIVIDGVSYPTKDISEIDTKDYPYLTMKLNDFQYAVKFNAHDFTLRKEGCSYGDTTE